MATMKMHTNRMLRPRILEDGSRRGLEGFCAFTHEVKPAWWKDGMIECRGEILGVYENCRGSNNMAIVITTEEMIVIEPHANRSVRYEDIVGWDLVPKEPLPEHIHLHLQSKARFNLPVLGRTGAIMDIWRFLISAVGQVRQDEPKESSRE